MSGCSRPSEEISLLPQSSDYKARGKELAEGLAACGFCHGIEAKPGSPLAGGRSQRDLYGAVIAPNITPDRTGILGWNVAELELAIRVGRGKGERLLSTEVHRGYEWLSQKDLLSLISYLTAARPINNPTPRRELSFIEKNTTGIFDSHNEVAGYVPEVERSYTIEYGRYLVDHVARCGMCHNTPSTLITSEKYLQGGKSIQVGSEEKLAPGINNSALQGIGDWSEADIVRFLKSGTTPAKLVVDERFCPVKFFRNGDEAELLAIAKYLKSVQ